MSKTNSHVEKIRAAAILTNSYVAATVLGINTPQTGCLDYNQLILYVDYTAGSSDSLEIKVDFNNVNSGTFARQAGVAYSAGTTTAKLNEYSIPAADAGRIRISIPIADKFVKVSAKCTGTATSSSCTITAMLTYV